MFHLNDFGKVKHIPGGSKYLTWGRAVVGTYNLFHNDKPYIEIDVNICNVTMFVQTKGMHDIEVIICNKGYIDVITKETISRDELDNEKILSLIIEAEEKIEKMYR